MVLYFLLGAFLYRVGIERGRRIGIRFYWELFLVLTGISFVEYLLEGFLPGRVYSFVLEDNNNFFLFMGLLGVLYARNIDFERVYFGGSKSSKREYQGTRPLLDIHLYARDLVGIALLVFLWVLLRRFFQRAAIKAMPDADRSALRAAVIASAGNWLALGVGAIVFSAVQERIYSEIPLLFKLWLVMPVIATLIGLFLAFKTIGVWRQGLLSGMWARLRYTIVTLCALYLCWFYYFWNILGWQYK